MFRQFVRIHYNLTKHTYLDIYAVEVFNKLGFWPIQHVKAIRYLEHRYNIVILRSFIRHFARIHYNLTEHIGTSTVEEFKFLGSLGDFNELDPTEFQRSVSLGIFRPEFHGTARWLTTCWAIACQSGIPRWLWSL